ncbi:MAG TPA: FAD-dependent oxidoreductase [Vicinamibacterales bacterium]|nr:FAD-dependent oxidoreductase [Vicinamibacterales bacterium]
MIKGRLTDRQTVAQGTGAFTFTLDGEMVFEAGQTCDFTLPDPMYSDSEGNARTFSIASSPADLPSITVATRLTGSAFKRSLLDAPLGTVLDVDGPYGSFTLHKKVSRPALLLAGGIGITPFRSMIKDATERGSGHHLVLLYSNRVRESGAFLDDLQRWAASNPNFSLVPVFTDQSGFITAEMIRQHVPDPASVIAYAAGPDAFVKAMRQALGDARIDPDDIRTEEFPGY